MTCFKIKEKWSLPWKSSSANKNRGHEILLEETVKSNNDTREGGTIDPG